MADHNDGSKCPENSNSTDCLLRLVLDALQKQTEEASGFNWDPITFGFTAPVGIFAALFAAIAIYQAFLFSAGGRRKSNRRAIGRWADRTRHEWSWRELNRLSIATTPVLRANDVFQMIFSEWKTIVEPELEEAAAAAAAAAERDEKLSAGKGWILGRRSMNVNGVQWTSSKRPSSLNRELPTATWFRFLDHIALNDLILDNDRQAVETTMADYLPGDLLAVPAYAEVGFIVAAAAAAGIQSMTVAPDAVSQSAYQYPVIVGNGWQLDFRQHPTLGTVAAFSSYGGIMRLGNASGSAEDMFHTHLKIATAIAQSRSDVVNAWSEQKMRCTRNQRGTNLGRYLTLGVGSQPSRLTRSIPNDEYGLSWILLVDPPTNYVPAIFPTRLVRRNASVLSMLALNSKFWSSPDRSATSLLDQIVRIIPKITTITIGEHTRELKTLYHRPESSGLPDEVSAQELKAVLHEVERGNCRSSSSKITFRNFGDPSSLLVMPAILRHCLVMLQSYDEFQEWFQGLSPFEKQYFRALLVLHIRDVEIWINAVVVYSRMYGKHALAIVTARLLSVTLILLKAEELALSKETIPPVGMQDEKTWRSLNLSGVDKANPVIRHLGTIRQLDDHITSEATQERTNPERGTARKLLGTFWASDANHKDLEDMLNGLYSVFRHECKPEGSSGIPEYDVADAQQQPLGDGQEHQADSPAGREGPQNEPEENPKISFDNGPDGTREDRTPAEVVDDVLVWKAIMVAMLFYTAPDNSTLLRSGIWEHVVPVI
ncbi:hypothetical protein QBC43DRAFT_373344 [Cladorrhinum sp. PSN259]|nr:hypothetical protein QBC43DRAFT_373344 [Cladorrhinum sp. PSN259]